ncbi:MAG: DUF2341 domain-containing protein, partial [Elusimicrobiota bacterium]
MNRQIAVKSSKLIICKPGKMLACLLLFASIFFLPSSVLFALDWSESVVTDFSDGIFSKTTSTVDSPEIKIMGISDWYDADWGFRQPITLLYSQNVVDHQSRLDMGSMIKNLVGSGRIRPDGADIRFTDSDGTSLIPYWVDLSTDVLGTATTTQIWIKIPSATASTIKTIFMYYSNPSTATIFSDRNTVDDLFEDWETGILDTTKWSQGGAANFSITASSKQGGNYAVRSGAITHTQESLLEKTLNLTDSANLTFYWAASSEITFDSDFIVFLVDSVENPPQACRVYGQQQWVSRTVSLPAGNRTLTWRYTKKNSGDYAYIGLDRTWVDSISIRKSAPQPTVDLTESIEFYGQEIYSNGSYYSNVNNTGAENSILRKATWSYISNGGSMAVAVRYSNTEFASIDGSPGWNAVINGANLNYQGQYMQYKVDLNANSGGTTAPILLGINLNYDVPPTRPTRFQGTAISSNAINWEWEDNSKNELGFRIYSSTKDISGYAPSGFFSSSTVDGLLYNISDDTTFYLEENLVPNLHYNRFLVAYSTVGCNISRIVNVSSPIATYDTVTWGQIPQINAEKFKWDTNDPVGDPGDNFHYDTISTETFTTNSTFYFTSNIFSTGPARAEYYRVVWDTNSTRAWINSETLWYAPTNFVYNNVTGNTASGKPQLAKWLSLNTTSAYFHVKSYNQSNVGSGAVDVGPFYFNGCPSRITDLLATASTTEEGAIHLTWTAPFANSTFTSISNGTYILKWANTLINSENQFNSAPYGLTMTTSVTAGLPSRYTITGLTPGQQYCFSIKTFDSDNNFSTFGTNDENVLYTLTNAAKVAKIVFKNNQMTNFVGLPSSALSIECQDSSDNPLKLFQNHQLLLKRDGVQVINANRGFSEDIDPWAPTDSVTILQGFYSAQFYYKDDTAGIHTMNVSNPGDPLWTEASQDINILPGKAATFVMDAVTSQDIGTKANITVKANDGYSASNISQDYVGGVAATVTLNGSQLSPPTHYFTLADAGQKIFEWQNTSVAGSGVFSVTENITQAFNDIKFITLNGAYISASQGMIKRTIDGGTKWFAVNSTGTGSNLRSIAVDDSYNYVLGAGNSGIVAISTDATQSFRSIDTGIGEDLYGIFFVDVSTVYACGDNGKIIKSTDFGETWSANIGPGAETNRFNSLYFVNASTGYACGNAGKAYKTDDGGASWSSIDPAGAGALNLLRIQFLDDDNGHISATGGKVFNTVNGGTDWTSPANVGDAPAATEFKAMHFYDANTGFVGGTDRRIYKTIDGGSTWSISFSSSATLEIRGISFVKGDTNIVLAVGVNGSVYRTTDGGINWNQITMTAQSGVINWNGLVLNAQSIATQLLQGRDRQAAVKITAKTMFGGSSRITAFKVYLSGGTGDGSDIKYVKLY